MAGGPDSEGTSPTRTKASDALVRNVRSRIAFGELREGDLLPAEPRLCEEFGLSKPTVREAMRVLEADGLIRVRRGYYGGAEVQLPTSDATARAAALVLQCRGATLGELYDLRVILEGPVPAIVGRREDRAETLAALGELVHTAHDSVDRLASVRCGVEFHRALVRASGNQVLMLFTDVLEHLTEAAGLSIVGAARTGSARLVSLDKAHDDHGRLVELLRRGHLAAAERHWRKHLVAVRDQVAAPGQPLTIHDVLD